MKILITSYYEIKDSLLYAANSLIKLGYNVSNYPLFRYYMDENDKLDNYVDHFIDYIKEFNPDILLWWYIGIPSSDMEVIVNNSKCRHIFFNWDEPQNWGQCDIKNKAKLFDSVFVCCEAKLNKYLKYGTNNSYLLYPGYDPLVHYPIIDNIDDKLDYTCDISIVCTNLYTDMDEFPNQYIPRKQLVDNIYLGQDKYNYKFHIYGPELFGTLYPNSYKGFVKYEDTNKIFNYSKINICTHVSCNSYKYMNERSFMILGSAGLLFIDNILGLNEVISNDECVIIDKTNYIDQIVNILENYQNYYIIRHNGYKKASVYTWLSWAKVIKNNL